MQGMKDVKRPVRRISPCGDGWQYFFGYYDLPSFRGELYLSHRVRFMDRLQMPEDVAEIGVIDVETGAFKKLAETRAWNFQQGAQLQWYENDKIVYNDWDGQRGYRTVVCDMSGRVLRRLPMPVATVSADGKYGISVNFSRIYDFRPGYGYCNEKDKFFFEQHPAQDGIFLVDMHSGECRMLADYEKLVSVFCKNKLADAKLVVNHITLNRESDRAVFLLRNFAEGDGEWFTAIGTVGIDGSLYVLRDFTYASHYFWREGGVLLIHADAGEGRGLYELCDKTQEYKMYPRELFYKDIHCNYSPDRRFVIGDGYPDEEQYRAIVMYDTKTGEKSTLGRFFSIKPDVIDIRCDLHAHFASDGKTIAFDSTHEGFRGIYFMDMR